MLILNCANTVAGCSTWNGKATKEGMSLRANLTRDLYAGIGDLVAASMGKGVY